MKYTTPHTHTPTHTHIYLHPTRECMNTIITTDLRHIKKLVGVVRDIIIMHLEQACYFCIQQKPAIDDIPTAIGYIYLDVAIQAYCAWHMW